MLETWAFKSQARYGVGGIFEFFDKLKPIDPTKVKGFFVYLFLWLTDCWHIAEFQPVLIDDLDRSQHF